MAPSAPTTPVNVDSSRGLPSWPVPPYFHRHAHDDSTAVTLFFKLRSIGQIYYSHSYATEQIKVT